jgi:hypothetical protein
MEDEEEEAESNQDENPSSQQRQQPGMVDAFRQLESLKSLGDDPEEYIPAPDKINVQEALAGTSAILSSSLSSSTESVSLEQDFAVYRDMLQEIEEEESAASYAEVLNELGGSALQTDDTYSQIISELGGTGSSTKPSSSSSSSSWAPTSSIPVNDDQKKEMIINPTKNDGTNTELANERLLEDALEEALREVRLNNPQLREGSILNDKEVMKEIESIFDRGNAQLMESLEEIRREQVRSN